VAHARRRVVFLVGLLAWARGDVMRSATAYCSFCRKSYLEVGPLVEGPGDVYICGECVELCQSIIDQEKRRRAPRGERAPAVPTAEAIRERVGLFVNGQEEAKAALALAAERHYARSRHRRGAARAEGDHVLLIGPPSASALLAKALAHALSVPFAHGGAGARVPVDGDTHPLEPVLWQLLSDCDFDAEAAGRGIVYVAEVDKPETQAALLRLWEDGEKALTHQLSLDLDNLLFVCGGGLAGLGEVIARAGRHVEQPVTADVLLAFGLEARLVRRFGAIARVAQLDEETLARVVPWVALDRMTAEGTAPPNDPGP
jgi:ATP-dependent Clp protease ATP-binding subunit ClpX